MVKKSLFGRLTGAFKDDDDETAEDIDKDVEAAVMATMSAETDSIGADAVLFSGSGDMGDTVYVLDLAPIYKMIGGRQGRAAAGLLEICQRQFDEYRENNKDIAVIKGDHFIMRFDNCNNEQGYRRAALIINEVGFQVLSDRFHKMEIPDLLVAADVGDITNEDGSVNTGKVGDVQKKGGVPISLDALGDDVPKWAKLVVQRMAKTAKLVTMNRQKKNNDIEMVEIKHKKAIADEDIKMVEIKRDRKKPTDIEMVEINRKDLDAKPDWVKNAMKADSTEKGRVPRNRQERRAKRLPVGEKNRRAGGLDRRGRGH